MRCLDLWDSVLQGSPTQSYTRSIWKLNSLRRRCRSSSIVFGNNAIKYTTMSCGVWFFCFNQIVNSCRVLLPSSVIFHLLIVLKVIRVRPCIVFLWFSSSKMHCPVDGVVFLTLSIFLRVSIIRWFLIYVSTHLATGSIYGCQARVKFTWYNTTGQSSAGASMKGG